MLNNDEIENLVNKAKEVMKYCYVPYSHLKVGAALLTKSNKIYLGCNIENASFTPTVCAERVAIFKAISEGEKDFEALAVVGEKDGLIMDNCTPCGVCRQVMREFCDDSFKIILTNGTEHKVHTLAELLPLSFSNNNL